MPSFDVVSEVDIPEVENALDQTRREVGQRYDFKGSKTSIDFAEQKVIQVVSDDEYKVNAVVEMLQGKLAKRKVSLKALEYGKVEPASGGLQHAQAALDPGALPDPLRAGCGADRVVLDLDGSGVHCGTSLSTMCSSRESRWAISSNSGELRSAAVRG